MLVSALVVAAAVALLAVAIDLADDDPREAGQDDGGGPAAESSSQTAGPDAQRARPEETVTPAPAPEKVEPVPSGPPIVADSHDDEDSYPLGTWARAELASGHLDGATVDGKPLSAQTEPLAPDAVVQLFGWAGVMDLGIRLPYVVLSACDKVFASVPVTQSRKDVAQNVHRNLEPSGWRAHIVAAQIPQCEKPVIHAWGVTPLGPALLKLIGEAVPPLPLPDSGSLTRAVQADPLLTPADVAKVPFKSVTITASKVNVRQCASTKCEVLAQLDGGDYTVYILQDDGEWSLLSFDAGTGWLASRLYTVNGDAKAP